MSETTLTREDPQSDRRQNAVMVRKNCTTPIATMTKSEAMAAGSLPVHHTKAIGTMIIST